MAPACARRSSRWRAPPSPRARTASSSRSTRIRTTRSRTVANRSFRINSPGWSRNCARSRAPSAAPWRRHPTSPAREPPAGLGRNTHMSRHGGRSRRAAFHLGAALAATLIASRTARAQDADAILARAVAAWSNVRTVQGAFEQTIENPLTGTSAIAHGTYAQERPNHLAIRFGAPAEDEVVAEGSNLWIYMPSSAPGQVIK